MIKPLTLLAEDPEVEIAALVLTLHETQQRLQELAGYEVDAVIHPGGHFYLLREAQEKLRRSEMMQRDFAATQSSILNALPAHIALLDHDGVIISVNKGWEEFARSNGFDGSSYGLGENYLEVCAQAHGECAEEARTVASGIRAVLCGAVESFALDYPCHSPTRHHWFRLRADPLHHEGPRGAVIMHVDITQSKLAEEALRESEARFRGTFEQAAVGIAHVSPEGRFLRVNDKLCAIVGYSREELLDMGYKDLSLPEDLARSHAGRLALLSGELPSFTTEKRYRRKDGTVVWTNLAATVERSETGEPKYLISVFEDITARKEAENEIRFNEQRYRSLVKATTAIVWDTPASGEFEVEQPGWSSFTGQTFAELRGWGWLQAVHPEDREETSRAWSTAVARRSAFELEHRLRAHDGKYHSMTARGVPILADDGTIVQWLGIHTDITGRKELEQQFLRAQRMESIGTLAGGIAHDLNNMLAPIMMSIELLKMEEQNPLRLELISMIALSAQRGADMVRQVLSFARGVEGRKLEVHVGHLIQEVAKIVRDTFPKNIEVRSKIHLELLLARGDSTQLHQVLLNLCVNARDAMPDGGTLTLAASNLTLEAQCAGLGIEAEPGPYLCIEVEDSGTGMTPEVQDRIFEPFFTTKKLGQGTGLGLSTSIAIIKSHGGFVRVSSELGMGTRFQVCLPAHTVPDVAEDVAAPVELPRGKGELVLVVDDEAAVRQITRQTLEAFGYRVVVASDGVEGSSIYAARREEIAIVLTDMMMPMMDGPAMIQVLLGLDPNVRIIAASGLNANVLVANATSAGIKHFLLKPYTAKTLLKTLRDVLKD